MNRRWWISFLKMSFLSFRGRRFIYLSVLILLVYALITIRSQREISDRATQQKGRQACKHPHLEVNSPEIMKFVRDEGHIDCGKEEDWVVITGNRAVITEKAKQKHGDIECSFTDIIRTNDFTTQLGLTTKTHIEHNLESSDFVRVICYGESGKMWSSVMAGVRYDQEIMDKTGWDFLPRDSLKLNVLMFGFDSLSRNTFIRKLPKSYEYLKKTLNATILEGYNIVGDGTPQALIPLLTGKTELELPDTRRRMGQKANYVNIYPFVWNQYKDYGYVTAFMEDTPDFGIFTYRLKGFDAAPTDHYMRPFYIDAQEQYEKHNKYCMGSIPRHRLMLDYMKNMYHVYKEKPKFIFGFHGEISHDSYNLVGAADDDLKEWMEWLKINGHLNNTVLIVMSDHGHRFAEVRNTQQGKIEERLPWFSFVFPPWFSKAYPSAYENLKLNSKRLTTPFDIHATLESIIHPNGYGKGDLASRSISILKEIPIERTCRDAFIEPHWCACLDWESVDRTDPIVLRAARAFVKHMNNYNSEFTDECAESQLLEVLWAARLVPTTALTRFHSNADKDGFVPKMDDNTPVTLIMYQLKLTTNPGKAVFEVSLTHDLNLGEFRFKMEDVSRINEYGSQPRCILQTFGQLRKFCYCKDLL